MPRTAPPETPGQAPKPDAFQAEATVLGAEEAAKIDEALTDAEVQKVAAQDDAKDLAATVAILTARMNAQDAEIARLRKLQGPVDGPREPVQLPKLKDVQAKKPDIPVLTEDGWYVPPKLPNATQQA